MKTRGFIIALILLSAGLLAGAQEIVTDESGEKIILYSDGTWEPYNKSGIEKGRGVFTPSDSELASNIQEFEAAETQRKELALRLIRKRLEVATLEADLAEAQALSGTSQQALNNLSMKLDVSKQQAAKLEAEVEKARKWADFLASVTYLSSELRTKVIGNWQAQNGMGEFAGTEAVASAFPKKSGNYTAYSVKTDVMLSPPLMPCQFVFSVSGKGSGMQRKDTKPELLFSYSDPKIEHYFKKGDLIASKAYLTSVSGGILMLNLEVAVSSRQAPQLFGHLNQGDFIRLTALDGTEIRLISNKSDGGHWEEKLQAYVYRTQYPLGAREAKLLRLLEIDSILIRWSKVQEEYKVFDVDLLSRQLACLSNG